MADTEKASLAYKLKDLDRKGVVLESLGKRNALALAVMTGLQNKACDGSSASPKVLFSGKLIYTYIKFTLS